MPDRRRYSFFKGLFPGDVLNFSKRSHYVREIMLERVYPSRVILPMKMHYGVPAVPCVRVGDNVLAGQCVGIPEKGTFSVPVHTGISGTVTDIKPITLPNGISTRAVVIKNDNKRARLESLKPRSIMKLSATEAINIITDAGVCGMGGEGIPTGAKLRRAKKEGVRDFLVNCLQSEPYSTSDLTAITEYPDYVVNGAAACSRAIGAKRCFFLISEQRKEQREALENSIDRLKDKFKDLTFDIKLFRERFPQGYYRLVAKALYGKSLDARDTLERTCGAVLSITGDASGIHNILVPIGTPVSELISNVSDFKASGGRIIWGNCLTGIEIRDPENTPIIKLTSAVSIIRRQVVPKTPCIHCGLCSECCPMGLSPNTIYEMLNQGLTQKASEEGARDCIACGSCSYICPAGIDLTAKIAMFAGEGRVIEVNSLLYNSGHTATEGELIYDSGEAAGGSLLEEYGGHIEEDGRDEEGRIVLPFDGGKKV